MGGKNDEFSEKGRGEGGHANPNEFRCKFSGLPKKAQHSFLKRGRGRGRGRGQRPFGSFPKIHSKWSIEASLTWSAQSPSVLDPWHSLDVPDCTDLSQPAIKCRRSTCTGETSEVLACPRAVSTLLIFLNVSPLPSMLEKKNYQTTLEHESIFNFCCF